MAVEIVGWGSSINIPAAWINLQATRRSFCSTGSGIPDNWDGEVESWAGVARGVVKIVTIS